jgi:CRISPR-associated protein Cmr2
VSRVFWQAKIWGLLHDPIFKALHDNSGRGGNSQWADLAIMQDWVDSNKNPEASSGKAMQQIHLADLLASASDRGAIGSLSVSVDYGLTANSPGLQISHLLSGAPLNWQLQPDQQQELQSGNRQNILAAKEAALFQCQIKDRSGNLKSIAAIDDDPQKVFWWLWRCLPIAACQLMGNDQSLLLMPAETRIPDASIWSHTSLTSAMAGALTGLDLTIADIQRWPNNQEPSRAYLATFSFTPIQELIKASRKMRDFWAGSWILHYLCAKVCQQLAQQYGPDSLIYPSLFQQPLIDSWLLQKWPDFAPWVDAPSSRQLLTAGFPNIIVMLLPEAKVAAAMQSAEQTLKAEWLKISDLAFEELQSRRWMPDLTKDHPTWRGWLRNQWQTYWSAAPVGDRQQPLTSNEVHRTDGQTTWRDAQNRTFQLRKNEQLFKAPEVDFISKAADLRRERYGKHPFNANVGSWWPYVFERTRAGVTAAKNARTWQLPTAFDSRSTISGLGSIVHPYPIKHKVTASEAAALWQKDVGFFDGREQLNATEVVKRVLHKVIPQLIPPLEQNEQQIETSYPDLTAGAIGYLKTDPSVISNFQQACKAVAKKLKERGLKVDLPKNCGIPWVETDPDLGKKEYHPRQLSPGWLVEEISLPEAGNHALQLRQEIRQELQVVIDRYYPHNNPTDWYVLAAGDGDSLSQWLKGNKLKSYRDYVPDSLITNANQDTELATAFHKFLDEKKRMGPSTHNALSRALLDFSNQLAPYLTEQRYAGRLVYSGGDDVLAYTNLWEWDQWLWDLRECFRGQPDPMGEFKNDGDYWQSDNLLQRPLFTMGAAATISFGIVIANQSVPLAITLENMWEAEAQAKEHFCSTLSPEERPKNAVQVRVIYGNGNILKATAKFDAFMLWRELLNLKNLDLENLDPAIFEQAAEIWKQHAVPAEQAIRPWAVAFSDRRDTFAGKDAEKEQFIVMLSDWLQKMWTTTDKTDRDQEIGYWLKLAAFTLRKRKIQIMGGDQ